MPDTLELAAAACDHACTACTLYEQCKSVCIPAVWFSRQKKEWPQSKLCCEHDRALYILGEAPGWNEDRSGEPWVGVAGDILKKLYLDYFKFADQVDIFLSNAVRCHPLGNKNPNKTQLKMCQGFYLADIVYLQKLYDQVIVLCCGAPATMSVMSMSLKKSFSRQGDLVDFRALTAPTPKAIIRVGKVVGPYLENPALPPFPRPCPVFTTYHPAAVGRDKNYGMHVNAHLRMLSDYLKGNLTYDIKGGSLDIQMAPPLPTYDIPWLSLDIETYGILEGYEQAMFHPAKSVLYDKVPRDKLVVTTGLTWPNAEGDLEHGIFIMGKDKHRKRLWSWIKKCALQKNGDGNVNSRPFEFLIGQNLKFDLMYLRYAYPKCKMWLDYPLPIADLTITNYLYNEGQPERSLKALAPLLRVTKYEGGFTQYADRNCPSLHQYNCQDTAATILSHIKLTGMIRDFYGGNSPKLSAFNQTWYSKLLWMIVWMEETGVTMCKTGLNELLKTYTARLEKLERGIKNRWGINLRGKGSMAHKRKIMDDACQTLLKTGLCVPKLRKTPSTGQISFNEENRNALLDALPVDSTPGRQLRAISSVHTVTGTLDRYLYPLLVGRGKGHTDPTTRLIGSQVYPRWYPVPSDWEDGSSGGTKQCRIVAKGPACQTFPQSIKKCVTSRYNYLVWFDYSQIELRIAALLSNDPWMMGEYSKKNCDFHLGTSHKIFGEADAKKYRPLGKRLNFLVIYLGGAGQYQATLMKEEGIVREYDQCQQDIDAWWQEAQGLHRWQEETYEFVCEHGYFELPLVGQSRLFLGNKHEVREKMKEIVNMPVQSVAANIMLSAQFELQWTFKQKYLKSILPLNVYDAATVEIPKSEIHAVKKAMARILPNPPYYQALCDALGRRLPLEFDVEIRRVTP